MTEADRRDEHRASGMSPLISVVIPTFDREPRMLAGAIDSVLAQKAGPLEVIVIDDGSSTPSAAVAEAYGPPVRYRYRPHGGCGSARNAGVALSSGSLLAFLDSDDLWEPDKLGRQLEMLESDPDLEAVFGLAEQFHDPELDEAFRERHPIKDTVIESWLSSAMLIHRESFDRIGAFSETQVGGVDIDWFLRARESDLRCTMLPQVVYRRRVHTTNLSVVDRAAATTGRLTALKRSLDRRRAAEVSSEVRSSAE
jgi:glycosyltransferase involved in cell wall biosynthesis